MPGGRIPTPAIIREAVEALESTAELLDAINETGDPSVTAQANLSPSREGLSLSLHTTP